MINKPIARIIFITAFLLSIPFVAMQFTPEVNWTLSDFGIAGFLLIGTGLLYELIVHKIKNTAHRAILSILLLSTLFVIWADLAVGIFDIPGISGS